MVTLQQLHQVVSSAIESKRIGTPVFVRYHLQGVLKGEGKKLAPLAKVVATVSAWLGQSADTMHTLTSFKDNTICTTLTLRYPNGATAIVSESRGQSQGHGVNLMVLGNKGALYHSLDAGSLHQWEEITPSLDTEGTTEIVAAIEAGFRKNNSLVEIKKSEAPPAKLPSPRGEVKKRYGILLVTGSHTHQENYAAFFAADPRCKLIAVTDTRDIDARRRKLNERLARELNIPYLADLDEALKRDDVDIVSICTEPERRGKIILRCIAAKKHLYLDKSLVPALDDVDAIREAARKAKVKSHMFTFISQPWAAEARQLLATDKLGTLLAIHADCFFAKGKNGTAKLGTLRKEEYPPKRQQLIEAKREFDNVGVYPITLIQWLTGKRFQSVYGMTRNYFFEEHQKHDVEDFGLLAGTLVDGPHVTISGGRYGWTSHPGFGVNQLVFVGTDRTLVIDANRPRLESYHDATPWTPPNVNPEDPMGFWSSTMAAVHLRPKTNWTSFPAPTRNDVTYFLDRLDAGKNSEMSIEEAADSAEVLLATYLSESKGEVVPLPIPRK